MEEIYAHLGMTVKLLTVRTLILHYPIDRFALKMCIYIKGAVFIFARCAFCEGYILVGK